MQGFIFTISTSAKLRLQSVLKEGEAFVVDVTSGGCNGFSYKYNIQNFDNAQTLVLQNPAVIVTEQASQMIAGGILEYSADEFGTSFFSIKNPNATSKCGCGNSFSTF
jgi:iron-sulfur cluster insertion protein